MSPSDLEVLIRGAAVGSFLVLAAVLLRPPRRRARTTGVLFSLSAAAHTLTQMSDWDDLVGTAAPLVWTFSAVGAGLFWAFATELFEDRNLQLGVRFLPAALLVAVGLGATFGPAALSSPLFFAHNFLSALLLVHVIVVIWRGWRDDLVEGRRQLRGPILVAAAVYASAWSRCRQLRSPRDRWKVSRRLAPWRSLAWVWLPQPPSFAPIRRCLRGPMIVQSGLRTPR